MAAWEVIQRCSGQLRATKNGPYALDFVAVLMMADAMGARNALLIDVLPTIEAIIVKSCRDAAEQF